MPTPRTHGPTSIRRGWSIRHCAHLLTGLDWQFLSDDGWGDLHEMPDDRLRETVAEMLECWAECQPLGMITSEHCGLNPGIPQWFAQYADDPSSLVSEVRKYRAYVAYQRAHKGYRPYKEFEAQYVSPTE